MGAGVGSLAGHAVTLAVGELGSWTSANLPRASLTHGCGVAARHATVSIVLWIATDYIRRARHGRIVSIVRFRQAIIIAIVNDHARRAVQDRGAEGGAREAGIVCDRSSQKWARRTKVVLGFFCQQYVRAVIGIGEGRLGGKSKLACDPFALEQHRIVPILGDGPYGATAGILIGHCLLNRYLRSRNVTGSEKYTNRVILRAPDRRIEVLGLEWRNWQTRRTQNAMVLGTVRVRPLLHHHLSRTSLSVGLRITARLIPSNAVFSKVKKCAKRAIARAALR